MDRSYIIRANSERSDYRYSLIMVYGDMEIVIGSFAKWDDVQAAQLAMEKSA